MTLMDGSWKATRMSKLEKVLEELKQSIIDGTASADVVWP